MSGRTQRQRKLTDMGVQYKKQLAESAKRSDSKKQLQDAVKGLTGLKVDDRSTITVSAPVGPAPARPLPGAPILRPPTFQYPPPPKDDVDDLASRFGKMGGKTRRRIRKHKKRTRK